MASQLLIDLEEDLEPGEIASTQASSPNTSDSETSQHERASQATSSICEEISELHLKEDHDDHPTPQTPQTSTARTCRRIFRASEARNGTPSKRGFGDTAMGEEAVNPGNAGSKPTNDNNSSLPQSPPRIAGKALVNIARHIHSPTSPVKTMKHEQGPLMPITADTMNKKNGEVRSMSSVNGSTAAHEWHVAQTERLIQRYEERQKREMEVLGEDMRRRLRSELEDLEHSDARAPQQASHGNLEDNADRHSHPIPELAHCAQRLCTAIADLSDRDRNAVDRDEWDIKAGHLATAITQLTGSVKRVLERIDLTSVRSAPPNAIAAPRSTLPITTSAPDYYRPAYPRLRAPCTRRSPQSSEDLDHDLDTPMAAHTGPKVLHVSDLRHLAANGHFSSASERAQRIKPERAHPRALVRYTEDMEWDAPAF